MKSLFWIIPQIERESVDLNGWTQAKTLTTECDSYLTCTVLVCILHRVLYTYTVHRHYNKPQCVNVSYLWCLVAFTVALIY